MQGQQLQDQLEGKGAIVSATNYNIFRGLINLFLIIDLCRFGGTDWNL